jgi:hypothetical protein
LVVLVAVVVALALMITSLKTAASLAFSDIQPLFPSPLSFIVTPVGGVPVSVSFTKLVV